MKFSSNAFGKLVRPRVLTHVFLYPEYPTSDSKQELDSSVDIWWKSVRRYYLFLTSLQQDQLTTAYGLQLTDLFSDINLGDTSIDLSECYVGEIISLIVVFRGSYFLIESKQKAVEFEIKFKKMFGRYARIPVCAVGLKFYKGMDINKETKEIVPINPWEFTESNNKIWFYYPNHIIPIENIIRFEKIKTGNIVLFKRSSGMVLSINNYNKKTFYKICSWTNRSIKLLTQKNITRFTPDRNFEVQSKENKNILW